MNAYRYPATRHRRRHGPAGYNDLESFRPWLRDEFVFRCVYCLERETWTNLVAAFAIDHFSPTSIDPAKRLDYENLLYACRACNAVKGDQQVPDPLKVMLADDVVVYEDGHIEGRSRDAMRLIAAMKLDRPAYIERRRLIWRTLTTAQHHDPVLYRDLLSYPKGLPDLSRLRPPSNTKPKGVEHSFHAQRKRCELSVTY